ncbi:unnamed protein product [Closterium sp. Naga37s-1]|nr:unnamed protein product [Closterium sp. Naga37s-1]
MELCIFTPAVFEAGPNEGASAAGEEEGASVAGQEEEPFVAEEDDGPSVAQKDEGTPVAGEEEGGMRREGSVEGGAGAKTRGMSDLLRLRQPHVEHAHPQGSVVAGSDSQEYATAGAVPQEGAVGVGGPPIAATPAASSHVPRSGRSVTASRTASLKGRTADSGRGEEGEAGEGYSAVWETDEHGESNVGGQDNESVHGSGASGGEAGGSSSASGCGSSGSGAEGWSVVAPWECSEASIAAQLKLRDPLKKGQGALVAPSSGPPSQTVEPCARPHAFAGSFFPARDWSVGTRGAERSVCAASLSGTTSVVVDSRFAEAFAAFAASESHFYRDSRGASTRQIDGRSLLCEQLDATDHVRRSSAVATAGSADSATASGRRDSAIRALAESILVACSARHSFAFSSAGADAAVGAGGADGAYGNNHGGARRSSMSSFSFRPRGSSSSSSSTSGGRGSATSASGGRSSASSARSRSSSAASFAFPALASLPASPRPSDSSLFTIAEALTESQPAVQDPVAGSLGETDGCDEASTAKSAADGSLPPDLSGLSNGELLLVAASRIALLTESLSESRTINEELMKEKDAALSLLMDTQRKLTEATTRAVLSMPRVNSSCDLAGLAVGGASGGHVNSPPSSPVAKSTVATSATAGSTGSTLTGQKGKVYLDDDDDMDYDESDDECDVARRPVAPVAPVARVAPVAPVAAEAQSAESEEAEYARFLEWKVAELQAALSQAECALESARAEREALAESQERAVSAALADAAASAEIARARKVEMMVALRAAEGQLAAERRRHVAEVDSLKEELAAARREKEGYVTSLEAMARVLDAQREERDVIITRLEAEKAEMVGELMDVIVEAVAAAGTASVAGNPVTAAATDGWKDSAPVVTGHRGELLGAAAALDPVLADVAAANEASADVVAFAAVAAMVDVAGREIMTAEVELGGKDAERVDAEMWGICLLVDILCSRALSPSLLCPALSLPRTSTPPTAAPPCLLVTTQRKGEREMGGEGEGGGEEGEGEQEGYAWQAFRALIDGGAMPGDYNEAGGVETRRDSTGTAGDFIGGDVIRGDSIEGDTSEVDVMQRRRRMSAGRRRWWDRGVMERVRAWEWRGGRQRGAASEGGRAEEGAEEERQVEQGEEEQRQMQERRERDTAVEGRGEREQGMWEVGEPAARGNYRRDADVGEARGFLGDEVWSEHALGGGVVEGEEVSARGRVMRMLGDDKENVEPAMGLEV